MRCKPLKTFRRIIGMSCFLIASARFWCGEAATKETEEVTETALHRTRLPFSFRN